MGLFLWSLLNTGPTKQVLSATTAAQKPAEHASDNFSANGGAHGSNRAFDHQLSNPIALSTSWACAAKKDV